MYCTIAAELHTKKSLEKYFYDENPTVYEIGRDPTFMTSVHSILKNYPRYF